MKCQILFSGKNKKNISKCRLLKILPRVLSVKDCINSPTLYIGSPFLYPRHTKYAKGVYSFCLFCVSVCLYTPAIRSMLRGYIVFFVFSVCLSVCSFILCQRFLKNYYT